MSAEEAEPAVLVRGPIQHSGIEYLGVNAVEAVYGEYAYNRQIIPVYYTDKDIFIPDEWSEAACAQSGLKHLGSSESSAAREVFVYSDRRGWHAFFSFPADADYICRFIEVYISRQNYFNNISRDKSLFSFPAVLEIE